MTFYKDGEPSKIDDFDKLRGILSRSRTPDSYCCSALYFAFTGRGDVWIVKHDNDYLVFLPHPNVHEALLVFFPYVSNATELAQQLQALRNFSCKSFLQDYQEVFLARIAEPLVDEVVKKVDADEIALERIDETKLDWAYPSYDVLLQRLVNPQGGKLKTYRKKIRKFSKQDIEIIRPKELGEKELRKAVFEVNKNWIRTKFKTRTSLQDQGVRAYDLMDPYRTLARISADDTSDLDGLILKRRESYVAFSFWERSRNRTTASCFAALPSSYEKGLSEYLYYCIADCLESDGDGYDRMCIGGSETASLDQFKKKFDPISTHRLQTIRLLPRSYGVSSWSAAKCPSKPDAFRS